MSDDYGGIARLSCKPKWGSKFFIGQTNVTCSAFDDHNNKVTCTFSVNIKCEYSIFPEI